MHYSASPEQRVKPLSPGILEEEPCVHGPGSNHVPGAQQSAPVERHRGGASPAATRGGHRCFWPEQIGCSSTANAEGVSKGSWDLNATLVESDVLAWKTMAA